MGKAAAPLAERDNEIGSIFTLGKRRISSRFPPLAMLDWAGTEFGKINIGLAPTLQKLEGFRAPASGISASLQQASRVKL